MPCLAGRDHAAWNALRGLAHSRVAQNDGGRLAALPESLGRTGPVWSHLLQHHWSAPDACCRWCCGPRRRGRQIQSESHGCWPCGDRRSLLAFRGYRLDVRLSACVSNERKIGTDAAEAGGEMGAPKTKDGMGMGPFVAIWAGLLCIVGIEVFLTYRHFSSIPTMHSKPAQMATKGPIPMPSFVFGAPISPP